MNIKSLIYFILPCLLVVSFSASGQAPIEFVENKGQWDSRVRFMAEVGGGSLFIHKDGFTVLQHNEADLENLRDMIHHHKAKNKILGRETPLQMRSHAYRASFVNASPKAVVEADKPLATYSNYFIGDPSTWASSCGSYQGITIRNLYPNIDIRYYSDKGALKYDLIVHPGGSVDDIVLNYEGADALEIKDKMLNIKTSIGTIREMPPYTYQYTDKGRQAIKAAYSLKGTTIRYAIKEYDHRLPLVIDPTMIFASFAKSTADNWGYTATYGPDGSMFGGGIVFSRANGGFPVSTGAFQQGFAGGSFDIGIIKLTPDGSNRIYATYLGGGGEEQPHSLIVDAQGNLVIAGRTNSPAYTAGNTSNGIPYPLLNQFSDQYGKQGGFDVIVTKLNADGTAILGSARLGGAQNDGVNGHPEHSNATNSPLKLNYGDDGRSEVILDGAGNVYVAACTQSIGGVTADNFPVTPGAFQVTPGGGFQDGAVLKFSPSISLLYSSYLGGSSDDGAFVLSLHPTTSSLFVAGATQSTNFPGMSPSSMNGTSQGGVDGFISEISNNGSSILRSTYVGTSSKDIIWGIKFDRSGFPYVMGQTLSSNWPKTSVFGQSGAKQFIMKMRTDLSGFVYSTPFGTTNANAPNISPVAFLVDRCENVYVSGWGGDIGFPSAGTTGLPVTSDALVMNPPYTSPSQTDGKDFYFFVLKKNGVEQLYGSFYGQNGGYTDHVDGGTSRFDENGVIYQAICANCSSNPKPYYPTTPGVWGPTNPGPDCNLAMVKIALNLSGIKSGVQSSINGVVRDTAGCVPLTVDFRDTVLNAVSYEWDFDGDGVNDLTTTTPEASYTYNAVRNYRVRLIAIDSNSCNIRDTSFMTVKVGDLQALPDFTFRKLDPCESLQYEFTNTSVAPAARPFTNTSFLWDFGDGSPLQPAGGGSVTHAYANPGPYRVRLLLVDTVYCNAPDVKEQLINIAVLVNASVAAPSTVCAPARVLFKNTSSGGQTLEWDFGDGTTITTGYVDTLSHFYAAPGNYTVRLRVTDSATCNITNDTTILIRVIAKPMAAIGTVTPQPPTVNTPLSFPNASSPDAIRFKWFFGDGDSLITTSRETVQHEYNATQTYQVLLIAYNSNGCTDTARRQVQTLIEAALDVPNAFTPLSGGINSVVMPRGFGIAKLQFTIYNRWGQKVYETTARKEGWDGKYKGVLQPMDVYAYTLEVEFSDGTKASKKGDITLIR